MPLTSRLNSLLRLGLLLLCAGPGVAMAAPVALSSPSPGQAVIQAKCMACHQPDAKGVPSRIGQQRKTPEGWTMTVVRMEMMHGVSLEDDERRAVVKYLADTQGLAPAETKNVRYAMERRLNTVETYDDEFAQMCARCHSGARVALQRRNQTEWKHLVHFHLGQWPSLEYQSLSRDRDWFELALNKMVPRLSKAYGFNDPKWAAWVKGRPEAKVLDGIWSFSARGPAQGDIAGTLEVKTSGNDEFEVTLDGKSADGKSFKGKGKALLYAGYEWRSMIDVGGVTMRQVFSALDGQMTGRMFEAEHDERGMDFSAVKTDRKRILAVQPEFLQAGGAQEIVIVGAGLAGKPSLGDGVEVVETIEATPERIRLKVKASDEAKAGSRIVKVGTVQGPLFSVYRKVDEVKVLPAFSVARVGGNGGATPKVQGRFDAEGWSSDAAGKRFRIGNLPARWSVEPYDERAAKDEDMKFAGTMAKDGIFEPAEAGPNPKRAMSTNNAGNLKVIAQVGEGEVAVRGEGHMIVTVQRWNNPPLP